MADFGSAIPHVDSIICRHLPRVGRGVWLIQHGGTFGWILAGNWQNESWPVRRTTDEMVGFCLSFAMAHGLVRRFLKKTPRVG